MARKPAEQTTTEQPAQRRGRAPAPENETPRQRFARVANLRLANALNDIRLIGQLGANASQYEYTADDVKLFVEKLNAEMQTAVKMLTERKTAAKATVTFFG